MPKKRSKTGQQVHDQAVRGWAKKMEARGYDVKADLPNMEKPKSIKGKIPGAVATKGKEQKALEVETKDTLEADKEQRQAFRNWSNQSPNRTFHTKTVNKKK